MAHSEKQDQPIQLRDVWKTWSPLAASWLLMGAELPLLSAVVARLPDPETHLAAYGGVVFPIALLIESPIIMLLAASTALSRDWPSYQKLRAFMMQAGLALTTLHALVAFTPLYDLVVGRLMQAPDRVLEPARIGFMFMLPWTWAIAYRRFNQGILIRFGYPQTIGIGTAIRLLSNAIVLAIGYWVHTIPGIIVATIAVATGVTSEAAYCRYRVRPVLKQLHAMPLQEPLTTRRFFRFYLPLAVTPFFTLAVQPILTAAMSRLPRDVASLAVWPAVNGLIFMVRSLGISYNEVVVALVERPGGFRALQRFTGILATMVMSVLLLIAATPLADLWFEKFVGLRPALADLARNAIWITVFVPTLAVLLSWYQGILVQGEQTRPVTEAVVLFLITCSTLLIGSIHWVELPGIYVGLGALTIGSACQTGWLWQRSGRLRSEWESSGWHAREAPAAPALPPSSDYV